MSNLGGYQTLTTWAKKVGGPKNLVALIAGSGVIVGGVAVKGAEIAVRKGKEVIKQHRDSKLVNKARSHKIYNIIKNGESNEGLHFEIGNSFRILEMDGDAILIELIGNDNNPYFVSKKLLQRISDWE